MNKRQLGTDKERIAAEYLEKHGLEVLEKNFRGRQGEIDIVAKDGNYLVFTEVKFRSTTRLGSALEAVNYKKQCRICKVADYYRYKHRLGDDTMIRYDVVAIQGEEIIWIKNAFMHVYSGNPW
ncbi:MAG: YraN family protein [Lachnospiraceae bacterium]|nr:YraN family protein [Lachnospiraceae bacterium]